MVDWMIEVLSNYKTEEATFFLSVNILDRYFKHTPKNLHPDALHLAGICAMFIASKFCDIYPIKLKMVVEKVGHNKFSADEIKLAEEEIIKTIDYDVNVTTLIDLLKFYIESIFYFPENNFGVKDRARVGDVYRFWTEGRKDEQTRGFNMDKFEHTKKYTSSLIKSVKTVALYLAKMSCHDSSLIGTRPALLAAGCLFVGVKIVEEMNSEEYLNAYFVGTLVDVSRHTEAEIVSQAQKVLYDAQNFDLLFAGLENLKKFHLSSLSDK